MQLSLLLLAPIALGAVLVERQGYRPKPGPWTMGAWNPQAADESLGIKGIWVGIGINANGGKFYIGKEPSAYCPAGVEGLDCTKYKGDQTWFVGGAYNATNGTLSLHVDVPGGQQVYIAPDGALSYTTAHSAMMPAGSLTVGWTRSISVSGGAPTVAGFSSGDDYYSSMACVVEGLPEGVWQIFMRTYKDMPNGPAGLKCKAFQIRTYSGCCSEEPQKAVAWQY